MAVITNVTTLTTAIADYLARSDLSGWIPNFIQNFEERFYRQPKNWGAWMETAFTATIANSVIAVPADFLAFKVVYRGSSSTQKLQPVPLSSMYAEFPRGSDTGPPVQIARNGANFEFGPAPDSNYVINGTYYAKPVVLRTDSDGANWLTANAPDLLLYGALLEAEPFLKNDARLPVWQGFFAQALQDYRDFNKVTDLSGGPLQTQVG